MSLQFSARFYNPGHRLKSISGRFGSFIFRTHTSGLITAFYKPKKSTNVESVSVHSRSVFESLSVQLREISDMLILGPFSNRYRSNYERSATCSVSKSHQSPLIYQLMKPTTRKRYERIRQAAAHMYGTMPVMHLYAALAHDFDLSEERIRKILAKNAPP